MILNTCSREVIIALGGIAIALQAHISGDVDSEVCSILYLQDEVDALWTELHHLGHRVEEEFLLGLIPLQATPRGGKGCFPLDLLTRLYRSEIGGACDGESLVAFGVISTASYGDEIPFIRIDIRCHRGGKLDVTHVVIGVGANVFASFIDPPYDSTMGSLLGLVV